MCNKRKKAPVIKFFLHCFRHIPFGTKLAKNRNNKIKINPKFIIFRQKNQNCINVLFQLNKISNLASIFFRESSFFGCGRNSPIWHVPAEALTYPGNPYLTELARPKEVSPEYLPRRNSVRTEISPAALVTVASNRTKSLATPRLKVDDNYRDPQWPVSSCGQNNDKNIDYQKINWHFWRETKKVHIAY